MASRDCCDQSTLIVLRSWISGADSEERTSSKLEFLFHIVALSVPDFEGLTIHKSAVNFRPYSDI